MGISSSLRMRLASAVVLGPLTGLVIIWGGVPFLIFVGIALGIAAYEWLGLVKKLKFSFLHSILGAVYLAVTFGSFVFLRLGFEQGAWFALTAMLCVWAADIGAYFFGKIVGGAKMAPEISPKKTWSGLMGGMLCSGLFLLFMVFVSPYIPALVTDVSLVRDNLIFVFVAGLVFGFIGQAGDLFVSFYKRQANIKDTGTLIPGHGGLLDRIDSIMLVMPVFLAVVKIWII